MISYLAIQENIPPLIFLRLRQTREMQAIVSSGKIDTILIDHPRELIRSIFQFPLGFVPTIMRAHIRLTCKPRLETFCPQGGEVVMFLGTSGRTQRTRIVTRANALEWAPSDLYRGIVFSRVTSNIRERENALLKRPNFVYLRKT